MFRTIKRLAVIAIATLGIAVPATASADTIAAAPFIISGSDPTAQSTMIQSTPERAMIWTVWIEGMVAIAPKVGRPSRQSWRRRLSGAGFVEVTAKLLDRMAMQEWGSCTTWAKS